MNPNPSEFKNFNTINQQDLEIILSISPRLARRIIALRPFSSFDQLDQVWGLEDETRKKIKDLFFVSVEESNEKPGVSDLPTSSDVVLKKDRLTHNEFPITKQKSGDTRFSWLSSLILIIIFLVGAYFRFIGINWDEGKHQHPDERYLTMVAEKIRSVSSLDEYFDTQNSPLNPVIHGSYTYGMLPLFVTRYVAEWVDMTSYDTINLVGRFLSGLFDLAAIFALYLLAKRLYGQKVALLAAFLSAVAVLPIQLSHFFTVDSFSTFFVVLSFYILLYAVPIDKPDTKITEANYIYFGIFGFLAGMAGACKVNTLPALLMIIFAGFLYLFLNRKQQKIWKSVWTILVGLFLSGLFAFLAFRIFQPYAFMGPDIVDITINERWFKVIKEVTNQVAGNSEWPPNHHWTSRPTQYAWVNMVMWGMGIPLGLMAWIGWGWAGYWIWKGNWRKHLFPFVWVFAYFVWQNIQFWRYMRYFIPVYPFLIMFAAWALIEIFQTYPLDFKNWFQSRKISFSFRNQWKNGLSSLLILVVILGTFAYAFAFTRIYTRTHTRVEASRWIFANIPGPLNVLVETNGELTSYPIEVFNNRIVEKDAPLRTEFTINKSGTVSRIKAPQMKLVGGYLHFWISKDAEGNDKIAEVKSVIADDLKQDPLIMKISEINLDSGTDYYLHFRTRNNSQISFTGVALSKNNQENPLSLNLPFQNQMPGIFTGSTTFRVDQVLSINQIILQNFHQEFIPTSTRVKVSLLADDGNTSLTETEETFDITQSGLSFEHDFIFSPVHLDSKNTYQIKFEVIEGEAIQLLAENYTLETSWDDSLPLGVDGYNVGGLYSPFNLELYEADTPEKRDKMIDILEKSEYIIVPSNRGYDAMPRLITRYPLTLRYYQLLFDCNCYGDELERWAYQLEPPFSSPLGFDLVEIFVSHPSLGFIKINDQNADESFTVYDHPKVFIFKKSDSFSKEKVKQELNQVDLDNVIFQRPIDVSKAENGLKLPEDRLTIQTKSGAWSEIFNRSSVLNQNSILAVVVWYLVILFLGWIALPISMLVFQSLPDKGYSLIRMVGLIVLTWFIWFSGSLKITTFSRVTILFFVVLLASIYIWLFYKNKKRIMDFFHSYWQHVLILEILFLLLFIYGLYIRVGNPDLWQPWYGGEKPMEFAFFNAVNKTAYFPPQNPWFSDHYINYYYYGFIVAAIPTKLLGIMPSIAFNLILPTWFAMTGIGLFGIGYNLFLRIGARKSDRDNSEFGKTKRIFKRINLRAYLSGFFVLVLVLIMGNLFQLKLLWKHLPEVSKITQDVEADNTLISVLSGAKSVLSGEAELPGNPGRWYFSASRPILPEGPDTPIAEFPYFSFLYADLHPHLLSMPFYALGFAWCISLLLDPLHKKRWFQQLWFLLFAGLIFGFYRVTHTWDYPVFVGLAFLSVVWMFIKDKDLNFEQQAKSIFLYTIIFIGVSIILYLPYTYWFRTAYNSVEIWKGAKTPLNDYFVVFGFSILMMISFFIDEIKLNITKNIKNWKKLNLGQIWLPVLMVLISAAGSSILWKFDYQVIAFGLPCVVIWFWIIFFKKEVGDFRRIIWVLFAIGFSITFIVEVLVLKGDVGRSNMVFRMYNLAWFILGISSSMSLIEIRNQLKFWPKIVGYGWLTSFVVVLILSLLYPITATRMKMIDRWPNVIDPPKTLDGSLYMVGNLNSQEIYTPALYRENEIDINLSLDYEGINFLQDHVVGSPVIVEGYTSEYRWGARYSIYTGLPTVIGWSWHTRQHNSLLDRAIVDKRIERVNEFYNTTDPTIALEFLQKYRVKYIIISGLERAIYSPEGLAKFNNLVQDGKLRIVYGNQTDQSATIYEVQ